MTTKPARRILHTADLHIAFLDDRGCQGLEAVVNTTIKNHADVLIIAGDLFDNNRIDEDLLAFVKAQFWRLPIPVIILPGNHDCLIPGGVFDRNEFWKDCCNLLIFRASQGETLDFPYLNVSIWGKPIDTYFDDVRPMQYMPQTKKENSWNIAVAHGYYVGNEAPIFPSYHITEQEIIEHDWDYIALGHVPTFRCVCNNPLACYSGSPLLSGTAVLVDLDETAGVHVTRCLL